MELKKFLLTLKSIFEDKIDTNIQINKSNKHPEIKLEDYPGYFAENHIKKEPQKNSSISGFDLNLKGKTNINNRYRYN